MVTGVCPLLEVSSTYAHVFETAAVRSAHLQDGGDMFLCGDRVLPMRQQHK
jgi:hypothetical protein